MSGGAWRRWVVTMGGAGMAPAAPGTVGSAVATAGLGLVYWLMARANGAAPSAGAWNGVVAAGVVIFGGLCVWVGRWATEYYGRKDPGAFVLDEGAGICLTALFLPVYPGWREAWVLLAVFASFRVFDIWKPPPAGRLERLPYGWGILLDDLAAAVYANLVCQVVFRVLVP